MFKNLKQLTFLFIIFTTVAGCTPVGDDDPWLSFRSRNGRLKNSWKLSQQQVTIDVTTSVLGQLPVRSVINSSFNGRDYFVNWRIADTLALDTTFGFNFNMDIKDDGKLNYGFSQIFGGLRVRSEANEQWHWQNDDRRKSKVYLGQVPMLIATGGMPEQFLGQLGLSENMLLTVSVKELRNDELVLEHEQRLFTTRFDGSVQDIKLYFRAAFQDK